MIAKQALLVLGIMLTSAASAEKYDGTALVESPLVSHGVEQMAAAADRSRDWSGFDLFVDIAAAQQRVEQAPELAGNELGAMLKLSSQVKSRYGFGSESRSKMAFDYLQVAGSKDYGSCVSALGAMASAEGAVVVACAAGGPIACGVALAALAGASLTALLLCEDYLTVQE